MAEVVPDEKQGKVLGEFAAMMGGLYGDGLVSLYLFGEAAVPPHGGRHMKLLAVMSAVGLEELRRYAGVYLKWHRKGIPAPLFLTEGALGGMTAVFPMEVLEMKEANVLLYGRDVLAGLDIGLENLRRQLEEQVKGKLIHLRQAYLEAAGSKKALAALMASSIDLFVEVMRNLLRVHKNVTHLDRETIIAEFSAEFGLDAGVFSDALRIRRHALTPPVAELEALFARYLEQVALMAEKVNGVNKPAR